MALPAPTSDSTVLITGASSGIGEGLARELASRGYGLTLVARRRARLDALAKELSAEHGVEATVIAADISRDRGRSRVLREARDGRTIVGLCNNAGVGAFGHVLEHALEEEDAMFRLNTLALFDLTNHLVRDMAERGEGAVLNTASILAFAPQPQNATYGATKAFIVSFSEALHTELAGTGVSCTTVNPGPTKTEIFDRSGAEGAAGFGPDLFWQDADDVAVEAVDAMVAGRRTVTPGVTNKLLALGYRFTPRTALLPGLRVAQSGPVRRFLLGEQSNGNDEA